MRSLAQLAAVAVVTLVASSSLAGAHPHHRHGTISARGVAAKKSSTKHFTKKDGVTAPDAHKKNDQPDPHDGVPAGKVDTKLEAETMIVAEPMQKPEATPKPDVMLPTLPAPPSAKSEPAKKEKADKQEKTDKKEKGEKKEKADKKAQKPPCLHAAVNVTHFTEEETFSLTRCDGSATPLAIERLSILARPGSAAKPDEETLAKSAGGANAKAAPPAFVANGIKRIDPKLVERLQQVIDHFGKQAGAHVSVVSGYRPASVGSFHASGHALDFRLDGVKNEAIVAFCKTLPDTGCGYYPNSSFVHLDVRPAGTGHVSWIDASGPGESPRYVSAWPPPPSPTPGTPSGEGTEPERTAEAALAKLDKMMPTLPPVDDHPAAVIPETLEGTIQDKSDSVE